MTVRITVTCAVVAGESRSNSVATAEIQVNPNDSKTEIERIVRQIFAAMPKDP